MSNLKFIEATQLVKDNFPIRDYRRVFKLYDDNNNTLGLATINSDEDNMVYIYVDENERNKGYGKKLFGLVLNELQKEKRVDAKVKFETSNIKMLRIVHQYNGVHLATENKENLYLIPISKGGFSGTL